MATTWGGTTLPAFTTAVGRSGGSFGFSRTTFEHCLVVVELFPAAAGSEGETRTPGGVRGSPAAFTRTSRMPMLPGASACRVGRVARSSL